MTREERLATIRAAAVRKARAAIREAQARRHARNPNVPAPDHPLRNGGVGRPRPARGQG